LQQNGLVVSPGSELEFFTVYEKARYANEPIFVTSDALLHSYHLLFDKVLRTAETEQFIPLLKSLNAAMLAKSDEIYQQLAGSGWEADAVRLVPSLAWAAGCWTPPSRFPLMPRRSSKPSSPTSTPLLACWNLPSFRA